MIVWIILVRHRGKQVQNLLEIHFFFFLNAILKKCVFLLLTPSTQDIESLLPVLLLSEPCG